MKMMVMLPMVLTVKLQTLQLQLQQQLEKRANESQIKQGTCQKEFQKGTANWSSTKELQTRTARSCKQELQNGLAKVDQIVNRVSKIPAEQQQQQQQQQQQHQQEEKEEEKML